MSDILVQLTTLPGLYRGRGDGAESGPFVARIDVTSVVGRRGVALDYEAVSDRRGVQHHEHSVLAAGDDGRLSLHVLCSELPGVVRFAERSAGEFVAYQGSLQARIVVTVPAPGRLVYSWWWSRDDAPAREQLRADVRRTG